jgi:hypothetical protein
MKTHIISLILIVIAAILVILNWQNYLPGKSSQPTLTSVSSPVLSPSPAASPSVSNAPPPSSSPSTLPTAAAATSIKLSVPFTIQAPDGDWSMPWEDGCEEAALLMADAFNKKDTSAKLPVAETKQKIADMVTWEEGRFGKHKDIGVDEMAIVAKEYLSYTSVIVKHNATVADIKNVLRSGKPVVVPAAGQLLGNPNFKQPGPPYHVFLIKGFDGDTFIANENGTRRGLDYKYSADVLQKALHDHQDDVVNDSLPMAYLVLEN